jgi:hypothetical protein
MAGSKSRNRRGGGVSRTKSSARWLARQRKDPFTKKAVAEGRVSRAHFKLEEIDRRCRLLRPGMRVLELGAAPGGWTRYIEEHIRGGLLIACDYRAISAGPDTCVVEGALGEPEVDEEIAAIVGDAPLDLVLSDMAPNISGIRTVDQALWGDSGLILDNRDLKSRYSRKRTVYTLASRHRCIVMGRIQKRSERSRSRLLIEGRGHAA